MKYYTNRSSIINIFFAAIPALILFSCGEPAQKQSKDTAYAVDSSKPSPKQNISVGTPTAPVPKNVSDSIFNGTYIERYPNGVIFKRGDIAGGEANGEWLTFYNDGKPWSQGIYKNGLRQGHAVSWWQNGQKSSEGDYKDGKMIGVWKWWDEQGNVAQKDYGGE